MKKITWKCHNTITTKIRRKCLAHIRVIFESTAKASCFSLFPFFCNVIGLCVCYRLFLPGRQSTVWSKRQGEETGGRENRKGSVYCPFNKYNFPRQCFVLRCLISCVDIASGLSRMRVYFLLHTSQWSRQSVWFVPGYSTKIMPLDATSALHIFNC